KKYRDEVLFLLDFIYIMDAYRSIAITSMELNFCFPEYIESKPYVIELDDVFHPLMKTPVSNSLLLDSTKHILFLTGVNMSGKSTLMKAVGIAVYLAHLGFPVPAKKMKISVMQGLITAINVSDNLANGYSHFYSEVRRVKLVAEKLVESKMILAIFDELFKSTNVKDAYDASL